MAGTGRRTFGGLFVTIGVLLLVAGLASAGFGYFDQQEHEDEAGPFGVAQDPDRSDRNEYLQIGGLIGAGLGLLSTIIGAIGWSSGREARRREEQAALLEGLAGAPAKDGEAPEPAEAPLAEEGPEEKARPAWLVPAIAGGVILLVTIGALALVSSDDPQGDGGLFGSDDADRTLDTTMRQGTVPSTVTINGNSQAADSTTHDLAYPTDTSTINYQFDWEPTQTGAAKLQVTFQQMVDNTWTTVHNVELTPGGTGTFSLPSAVNELRYRVFPAEDGIVEEQAYTATFAFVG